MDDVRAFWQGLTTRQRTIIIVAVIIAILVTVWSVLASYVLLGTDYSGAGDWIQSWFIR